MRKIDLTRKQLYELVWEKPLNYIIEIYGGTYQEVKELLKKYNIPSPENGYWSRLRAGHNIPRIALPNGNDSEKVVYKPKEKKKRIKPTEHTEAKKDIQIVRPQDKLVIEAKKIFQNNNKGRKDDSLRKDCRDKRLSYKNLRKFWGTEHYLGFARGLLIR